MALTWTGDGRGTAVLLHGMMSLAGTWWQIGPALAERGWDVTALDLAAHGGNRLDGPLTADALVDSVTAQVAGPVDLLVGHSMGAATAISTVARRPGFARAVVLEDPPGGLGAVRRAAGQRRRAGRGHRPARPGPARPPLPRRPSDLGAGGRRAGRARHRGGGRDRGGGRHPDRAARLGHPGAGGRGRRAGAGAGRPGHPRPGSGPAGQRAERRRSRAACAPPCRPSGSSSFPAVTACTVTCRGVAGRGRTLQTTALPAVGSAGWS